MGVLSSGVVRVFFSSLHSGNLNPAQIDSLPAGVVEVPFSLGEGEVQAAVSTQQVQFGKAQQLIKPVDLSVLSELEQSKVISLLTRYQCLRPMRKDLGCTTLISHEIPLTDGVPIRQRYRRLPPAKYDVVKAHIHQLIESQIKESLDALSGARWFSTLDLASGYNQVPVEEKDVRLLSVPLLGFLNSIVCPLGYAMPQVHCPIRSEVKYLGHVISNKGVSTHPEKITAVANWPRPQDVAALRSFLGTTSYYRQFVKNFSVNAASLYGLTGEKGESKDRKGVRRPLSSSWTEACESSFQDLNVRLTTFPVLAYANFSLPFILEVEASQNRKEKF
ncbi:putative mitochondrial protein [Labeo rohita]|uniref:Mitochondrial protein n=1 Tax=Labeo rohita TaxID=84645 RepID=A0ABQ8MGW7_LABRO|nr:putative mitochondrial protein [Labeo rohita]